MEGRWLEGLMGSCPALAAAPGRCPDGRACLPHATAFPTAAATQFGLIAERYERKSLAITANQPFSGWDDVSAEPAMTLAAADRLVHHATIFEMNVESFRRRAASAG